MSYNPDIHHRKSLRLQHYDYSQAGAYFFTICSHNRACLFGQISQGAMYPNDAGRMVYETWSGLPQRYPRIELDAFVVMPNHAHGILVLDPDSGLAGRHVGSGDAVLERYSFGVIVGAFKSMATVAYIKGVREHGWPSFPSRLWQRNFYERVLRDERTLDRAREYIANNPAEWATDPNHPDSRASP